MDAHPAGRRNAFGDGTRVLLGRVRLDGTIEFVNLAWGKVLGYDGGKLLNRPFFELLALSLPASRALMTRVLNAAEPDPMEFHLLCRDRTRKLFTWHRRFDPATQCMYIAGEEIADRRLAKLRGHGASRRRFR